MPTYAPIFLGACSITINAVEYGPIISSAQFNPTNKNAIFQGLDGTAYNFAGKPVWGLALTMAQDWAASGIGTYFNANVGVAVPCVLHPVIGGPGFSATVVLEALPIGGQFGTVATGQVTLGVNGQPVQASS
jgi:hypothetical protein